MSYRRKVFLSYSNNDANQIEKLKNSIVNNVDIEVLSNVDNINNNFVNDIRYSLENSDIVVLFLSNNYLNSKYTKYEMLEVLAEFKKRSITVIPVIIEKCNIPSDLLDYQIIDLSKSNNKGINLLLERIKADENISLNELNEMQYSSLIKALLNQYGFKIVDRNISMDYGFDFICEYETKNPFGQKIKETWVVELKLYKNDRFSINTIKQVFSYKKNLNPVDVKLLLITNSLLTSAAMEYLNELQKHENTLITIIDGHLLKELILKNKKLYNIYKELKNA